MKLSLISNHPKDESSELSIMEQILIDQNIPFSTIIDIKKYMELSKGHRNPGDRGVFIIVDGEEKILKDYFDLVNWIQNKGLKLL